MESLSLTGRRWRTRLQGPPGGTTDDVTLLLREQRGIPERNAVTDPMTDPRMALHAQAAAQRVQHAVKKGEIIGVFGDYDCDGITAMALMARYFHRRGIRPALRLPHRLHEGYGLSAAAVDEFQRIGATLLITVDTGVTAIEHVRRARAAGMDVIIIDHHHPLPELPNALAILHPSVHGLPEPHPSAAGIAWSFVSFLEGKQSWEGSDTDIALGMIGTVADLVPLQGWNRTLVRQGLDALQTVAEGPLRFLRIQTGLTDGIITSRDVAFRIAPRLNAAGRMADPSIALTGILGDETALLHLESLNRERQDLTRILMEGAIVEAKKVSTPFIALKHASYLPGVCGLIAGKLTEKFGVPTLVAHEREGTCVASLRSIPGYNVTHGLTSCQDILLSFGGHTMAAGCSFRTSTFDDLRARLAEDVTSTLPPESLTPLLEADMEIDPARLSLAMCTALSTLEPHGQGNPEPAFLLRNVTLQRARVVGKDSTHLQGFIGDHKCVGFGLGEHMNALKEPIDVICRLGVDTWNGNRAAQLFIDDVRIAVHAQKPALEVGK